MNEQKFKQKTKRPTLEAIAPAKALPRISGMLALYAAFAVGVSSCVLKRGIGCCYGALTCNP